MLTTHPSIMLGSYAWDEDRLPRDEFDLRLASLRDAMRDRSWSAIMIYGDAREHGDLAWFTNFIPRMRWAMAILPRDGQPLLLASMSSRDMPAMRAMTWIADVRSGWEWKHFEECSGKLSPGAVATIGFDRMTPLLFSKLRATLGERHALQAADELAHAARRTLRPRETALIAVAADMAQTAADAMRAAWAEGRDLETTALAGERAARRLAAQDVRTLVSRDGGATMAPYEARLGERPDRLLAYVAVKYMGYWGESFASARNDPLDAQAQRRMDDLLAAAKPGATAADLGRPGEGPAFLGASLGHAIGVSPNDGEDLTDGDCGLRADVVYAFRTSATNDKGRAAVASAMAVLGGDGALRVLARNKT
jgi:hypothetical protein